MTYNRPLILSLINTNISGDVTRRGKYHSLHPHIRQFHYRTMTVLGRALVLTPQPIPIGRSTEPRHATNPSKIRDGNVTLCWISSPHAMVLQMAHRVILFRSP